MKSGSDLVGFQSCSVEFRQNPDRNLTERNPTKTLSDPIEIISIRRDPIPPQSHGMSIMNFNTDDIIIEKGKPGSRFYIIVEGTKKEKQIFVSFFF